MNTKNQATEKTKHSELEPMHIVNEKEDNGFFSALKEFFLKVLEEWKILKDILTHDVLDIIKLLQEEECIKKINELWRKLVLLTKLSFIVKQLEIIFFSCVFVLISVAYCVAKMFYNSMKEVREKNEHAVEVSKAEQHNNCAIESVKGDKEAIQLCKLTDCNKNQESQIIQNCLQLVREGMQKNLQQIIIHLVFDGHFVKSDKGFNKKEEETSNRRYWQKYVCDRNVGLCVGKERYYFYDTDNDNKKRTDSIAIYTTDKENINTTIPKGGKITDKQEKRLCYHRMEICYSETDGNGYGRPSSKLVNITINNFTTCGTIQIFM